MRAANLHLNFLGKKITEFTQSVVRFPSVPWEWQVVCWFLIFLLISCSGCGFLESSDCKAERSLRFAQLCCW